MEPRLLLLLLLLPAVATAQHALLGNSLFADLVSSPSPSSPSLVYLDSVSSPSSDNNKETSSLFQIFGRKGKEPKVKQVKSPTLSPTTSTGIVWGASVSSGNDSSKPGKKGTKGGEVDLFAKALSGKHSADDDDDDDNSASGVSSDSLAAKAKNPKTKGSKKQDSSSDAPKPLSLPDFDDDWSPYHADISNDAQPVGKVKPNPKVNKKQDGDMVPTPLPSTPMYDDGISGDSASVADSDVPTPKKDKSSKFVRRQNTVQPSLAPSNTRPTERPTFTPSEEPRVYLMNVGDSVAAHSTDPGRSPSPSSFREDVRPKGNKAGDRTVAPSSQSLLRKDRRPKDKEKGDSLDTPTDSPSLVRTSGPLDGVPNLLAMFYSRKKGESGDREKKEKGEKGEKHEKWEYSEYCEKYEKGSKKHYYYYDYYNNYNSSANSTYYWKSKKGKKKKKKKKHHYDYYCANATYSPAARPSDISQPSLTPTTFPVTQHVTANPIPINTFTPQPSALLSNPTTSPAPVSTRCAPTVGPCLDTVQDLQSALDNASEGETVAVCARSSAYITTTPIVLGQSDTTVCCAGSSDGVCVFRNIGTSANLAATGRSLRLRDLHFEDGVSDEFFGGNVAVDAPGDHVFEDCYFRDGKVSELGGNLFVHTNGTVTIKGSTFVGGRAGTNGGGLYVLNAQRLTVYDSTFEDNQVLDAQSNGGGLYSVLQNTTFSYSQEIEIKNSVFRQNVADIGGGFFVTQLGSMPSLAIMNTTFESNQGRLAAGLGGIGVSLDTVNLTVSEVLSTGNSAEFCNEIVGFFDNSTSLECFNATTK